MECVFPHEMLLPCVINLWQHSDLPPPEFILWIKTKKYIQNVTYNNSTFETVWGHTKLFLHMFPSSAVKRQYHKQSISIILQYSLFYGILCTVIFTIQTFVNPYKNFLIFCQVFSNFYPVFIIFHLICYQYRLINLGYCQSKLKVSPRR